MIPVHFCFDDLFWFGYKDLVYKSFISLGFSKINELIAVKASENHVIVIPSVWKSTENQFRRYYDQWHVIVSATLRSSAKMMYIGQWSPDKSGVYNNHSKNHIHSVFKHP
jgi:hypothetical protein